jgi:hypothetical protein
VILLIIYFIVESCDSGSDSKKSNDSSSPKDQITTIIQTPTTTTTNPTSRAYGRRNAKAYGAKASDFRKLKAQFETMSSSVANIQVTGYKATADVTIKLDKQDQNAINIDLAIHQRGRQLEGVHPSGYI